MLRLLSIGLVLVLTACPHRYPLPAAPRPSTTPVPIDGINSKWDDFNSADMSPLMRGVLVFSTNRGSEGRNFDLYQSTLSWSWVEDTRELTPTPFHASEPTPFAPALMSDRDERGPVLFADFDGARTMFGFASNRDGGQGGLDLYVTACEASNERCTGKTDGLHPLSALNSPADDAYLTRPFGERNVLFASSRGGGSNDIYTAHWDAGKTIDDPPATLQRVAELSTDGDDTAPFVYQRGDTTEVVFVSTRAGGLGEHDIWCSRLQGGAWQSPVTLGPTINSARDEYRPLVIEINGTSFLVFSSTRDGGQGGYDLYIVGYSGCPIGSH